MMRFSNAAAELDRSEPRSPLKIHAPRLKRFEKLSAR
jgi:hypothetical protein